MKLKTYN